MQSLRPATPVLAIFVFALVGCPDRPAAPRASVPVPAASPTMFAASAPPRDAADFISQQLAMRVAQYAGIMIASGGVVRGSLAQGASASHSIEIVGGHCYRVVAVGGVEVNDLDLVLFGPDGSEIDSDRETNDYPSLGSVRPLCPPNGGSYRVEVQMHSGQGEYGLQVFRTP